MLKRIQVGQLCEGMFLHELCGSWMEHPFWRMKFVLRDPKDLQRILASGIQEVWIDTAKGLDVQGGRSEADVQAEVEQDLVKAAKASAVPPTAPEALGRSLPAQSDPSQAFQQAAVLRDKAMRKVQSLFSEARMGRSIHAEGCAETVGDILGSINQHQGALISLLRLKTQDEYTYLHSVAVCTLMVALGRTLGLTTAQLHEVGMAGLLHDLGKARIPALILNKPGKLSDEEFLMIKRHPEWGHELLRDNGATSTIALDVVLNHHEKVDGTGYPGGLKGEQLSLYAKMGAVCDVYDAVTSSRPYKHAWDPGEALRQMAQWKGHFDSTVFQAFVKTVGIFPIGTLVRLKSNRLAVVYDQSTASLLKPRVRAFYDAKERRRLPVQDIDLGLPDCPDAITGLESAETWQLGDLTRYWLDSGRQAA